MGHIVPFTPQDSTEDVLTYPKKPTSSQRLSSLTRRHSLPQTPPIPPEKTPQASARPEACHAQRALTALKGTRLIRHLGAFECVHMYLHADMHVTTERGPKPRVYRISTLS